MDKWLYQYSYYCGPLVILKIDNVLYWDVRSYIIIAMHRIAFGWNNRGGGGEGVLYWHTWYTYYRPEATFESLTFQNIKCFNFSHLIVWSIRWISGYITTTFLPYKAKRQWFISYYQLVLYTRIVENRLYLHCMSDIADNNYSDHM